MVLCNDSRGPWGRHLRVWNALAARSSSWGLGESGSVGYSPSLAQDPREGPVLLWMPVSAMISSKRLGVQERPGCCTVNTEAPVEGPYESWAGSTEAGAGPRVGTQWLVVKVRAVAMGHVMPLALLPLSSYLARPGTEVLKTPGEGVGVGMVGPVGSWEVPPVSPGLSHPLRGRDGVGVRVTAAVAIGRGLPCSHRVGCDRVWCMGTPPPCS